MNGKIYAKEILNKLVELKIEVDTLERKKKQRIEKKMEIESEIRSISQKIGELEILKDELIPKDMEGVM